MGPPPSSAARALRRAAGALAAACLGALGVAACGSAHTSGSDAPAAHTAALTPSECATAVATTLGEVGARIYRAAGHGVVVGQATHRIESSAALASAIRSGNERAIATALKGLLLGQIVRIQIERAGHVIASAGSGVAIAPVSGSIPASGARYTLSVQSAQAYLQVARQVTGAEILVLAGGRRLAGTIPGNAPTGLGSTPATLQFSGHEYEALALGASRFPSGAAQLALLVPSGQIACHGEADEVRVETLGGVGERIYREERESDYTKGILGRVERSRAFIDAVARRDVQAVRAAIVGFFAAHIHVVRVRVSVPGAGGERLLYDLGGPHVLAPVLGTLRSGGRVIGHFRMAIQDDAGYMKLARRFTGADVLMRTSQGQVEGTLKPGPKTVPDRGPVDYNGTTYQAYSFTGEAFPSGALRISLLLPA